MKTLKNYLYLSLFLLFCNGISAQKDTAVINDFIDRWHHAAAEADEDVFFGSMTADAIYLGTDASERWYRDEMKQWSAPYFEREHAWRFRPVERNIYFSGEENTAWFDELLDTWMGRCRGSGVLKKEGNEWKIVHYHLSVTVHNDLIREFIEVISKDSTNVFYR